MKIDGVAVPTRVGELVKQQISTQGWHEGILPFVEILRSQILVRLGQDLDEKETTLLRGELRGLLRISRIK